MDTRKVWYNYPMSFWDQFQTGFTCLAPMEGVTDIVFRQVVTKSGRPDIFFTEFTNVDSYVSEKGRDNALERFRFLPEEQPIVAQIWGKTPEHFETTAKGLKKLGYQAVDINMGCPDRHVVANGGGSALIRTPELAQEIIRATKKAGLPVSVKTRLGYTFPEEYKEWLPIILQEQPAALTVHLRTKKEMSKVDAHYELVPDIVRLRDEISPQTKLIINGDIAAPQDGQKFIQQGVDGIMIGRGVFQNPFCFEKKPQEHSRAELIDLLKYHLNLHEQYKTMTYEPLKRFFKIYINNFPGAASIRAKLMETHSVEEAHDIIDNIK